MKKALVISLLLVAIYVPSCHVSIRRAKDELKQRVSLEVEAHFGKKITDATPEELRAAAETVTGVHLTEARFRLPPGDTNPDDGELILSTTPVGEEVAGEGIGGFLGGLKDFTPAGLIAAAVASVWGLGKVFANRFRLNQDTTAVTGTTAAALVLNQPPTSSATPSETTTTIVNAVPAAKWSLSSWTVWLNGIAAVAAGLEASKGSISDPKILAVIAAVVAIANVALRFKTKEPIK